MLNKKKYTWKKSNSTVLCTRNFTWYEDNESENFCSKDKDKSRNDFKL